MYAWTGSEWGSISSTAEIYRFRFTASGGETTISGLDDNGLTLSYLPGKEQVYLNGVLLVRTTDYTASNGTSLTSLAALAASDIVEVITFTSFEVADAIARTVFDAKGDILVGTAADTVGKLTVGTNGYYLKANSSTATGLEWSAVSQYSLPSQTGNAGKFLTTDGSTESWSSTGDITGVTAGTGLTGGGTSGAVTLSLDYSVVNRLTFNAQTGTTYTLVAGDASSKLVTTSNASAITVTVPSGIFSAGDQINIQSIGAGLTTIVGSGTTITSTGATSASPILRKQYSGATIICTASNVFTVLGDIV
jgi:hypothetical protein